MTLSLSRRALLAMSATYAALSATGVSADTPAAATPAAPATAIDPASLGDYGIGDKAAKITIVEYLSLTCPHCEHFHANIYPKLKADYIDTGKVRLEYREVYFDQLGLLGAMLARCGGEMRYMGIVDMLYDKQRDWAGAADMGAATDAMKKIARAAGMTDDQSDKCLHDNAMAEALVAHYQANIAKDFPGDSFQGTPSFIVNGVVNTSMNSNMDYTDLQKILDAELAK